MYSGEACGNGEMHFLSLMCLFHFALTCAMCILAYSVDALNCARGARAAIVH
jgi:hypothetical protein